MLPSWEERPLTIAHLLNPAFCGEVVKRCIVEFQKINTAGLPYQLTFLILPMILNKNIRNSLPKSSGKNFVAWIEENQILKKDLPEIIKNIVPYTQETIMFLMMYDVISINLNGHFETKSKNKVISDNDEVSECYKKAELLGKLFAKAGTSQFVFINLGIKP
jgi:hypothetical protein